MGTLRQKQLQPHFRGWKTIRGQNNNIPPCQHVQKGGTETKRLGVRKKEENQTESSVEEPSKVKEREHAEKKVQSFSVWMNESESDDGKKPAVKDKPKGVVTSQILTILRRKTFQKKKD